jgi:flagellar hook-associated protein 2
VADLALSGLASGVDTSGIVEQLMTLEAQSQNRVKLRQKGVSSQQTFLRELKTKLTALKSAAQDLRSAATWGETQTVESTDAAKVAVARTGGAPIGGYSIQVTGLASSAQKSYTWTESASASQLTFDDGNAATAPVTIDVAAGAKITDVAAQINGRGDLPVYAAVVGGTKLVLSSRATGAGTDFSATGAQLGAPTDQVAARSATYLLDGDPTVRTSPSNVVEDAIPGVRLTLKSVTTSAVGVTVGAPGIDREKVKTEVKAFVEAYNAVVTATRAKLTEKKVAGATTDTDAIKGQFFGDSGLTSMLSSLRTSMSKVYTGIGNAATLDDLNDIGISSGKPGVSTADAKAGLLQLDESKLTAALEADAQGVRRLLGGTAAAAFAQDAEALADKLDDMLDARIESSGRESKRIADELSRMDKRLELKEKRLKAQFAAMESLLSSAQAQQSWLAGQINALGASSS